MTRRRRPTTLRVMWSLATVIGLLALPTTVLVQPSGEQAAVALNPAPGPDLDALPPVVPSPPVRPADGWSARADELYSPSPPPPPEPEPIVVPPQAAGALRILGVPIDGPVGEKDLVAAASAAGIEPAADDDGWVTQLLHVARQQLGPTLRGIGVDYGSVVDDRDLKRAAHLLGFDLGSVADPHDVDRLLEGASDRLAPVLWTVGGGVGHVIDDADLQAAANRLGLGYGSVLDPADIRRLIQVAAPRLHQVTAQVLSPGLKYARWTASTPDGEAVVHTLRWNLRDPRVEVRTEPARELGAKTNVPNAFARRERSSDPSREIVAMSNGGFWVEEGDPDGLLVLDGDLVSDPTAGAYWVRGLRGGFGLSASSAMVGRPSWYAELRTSAEDRLEIRGLNRPLRGPDDVVAYTRAIGAHTPTPPGTVEVTLPDVPLDHATAVTRQVTGLRAGGGSEIPAGGIVVAARGKWAAWLKHLRAGGTVSVNTTAPGGWPRLDQALNAGPLLLENARLTNRDEWLGEGFPDRHTLVRHPRTAIGFGPDGHATLIVVDGRRPGYSVGMTVPETAAVLRSFGATNGVMLDGGGSSHLVGQAGTINRPCCDPDPRPVATVVGFYRRQAVEET